MVLILLLFSSVSYTHLDVYKRQYIYSPYWIYISNTLYIYAHALFAFCEALARARGISALRVDTYEENDRMRALILRQGFTPVGAVHFPQNPLPYPCFEKVLGGCLAKNGKIAYNRSNFE